MLAGVFAYTNQGLQFALATYFNTFLWEFPASTLGLLTIAVMVGVALAFIGATRASRSMGKRRAAVSFLVSYVAVAITPYLLRYAGWFPANDDPVLVPILFITTVVSHAFGIGGMILGASMMSDVVEDLQARTGKRTEGLFFAGSFFMQKCVSGFGLFFAGAILTWVAFPAHATPGARPRRRARSAHPHLLRPQGRHRRHRRGDPRAIPDLTSRSRSARRAAVGAAKRLSRGRP